MAKLTLYHASPSRSSIVRWMLEEVGEPYDIHLLRLMEGDQSKPDYLAINPMGKVPAITHGDAVVTECAAICAYLADAFPQAKLAPPPGDRLRARVEIRHVRASLSRPDRGLDTLGQELLNQHGQVVLSLEGVAMIRRRG